MKRSLLTTFRLQPAGVLEDKIKRYDIDDWQKCLADIERRLGDDYNYSAAVLVEQKATMNLPQMNTRNIEEIEKAHEKFGTMDLSRYQEIWHVRNKDAGIWGRYMVALDDLFPRVMPATVEIIGARDLKNLYREINRAQNTTGAYVRMESPDRPYPFNVVDSVVNNSAGAGTVETYANLVGVKLKSHNKKIIELGEYLKALGAKYMTVDFYPNVDGDAIYFHDWDTDNDDKVFTKLEEIEARNF